jgi:uncharacterized protein YcfJ
MDCTVIGALLQGFKGSRVQGFKGSRVQGFKGSRVQGFKGSRVQGFKEKSLFRNSHYKNFLCNIVFYPVQCIQP